MRRVANIGGHLLGRKAIPHRRQDCDCLDCGANTPRGERRGPVARAQENLKQKRAQRKLAAQATQATDTYGWRQVHDDLENGNYAGCYGWDNAVYWGIAEKKAGVDLTEWYKRRTEAEFYSPQFHELINDPETQKSWDRIVTFDPMGMYAHPPTIAACAAHLDLMELQDMEVDGKIIGDQGVNTVKAAVYYTWNIPALAERLDLDEEELRDALFKYSKDPSLKDPNVRTFIPAVGGCTIYTFGDIRRIRDPSVEVCVRVHDECIGSDVFGSDICTCRPYLIFALRQCVECAQRDGVGIVVYYRKEGRSLGEVIKFRVYNARINQEGGDRAETYFEHTESIAGIRDARFQDMMPDVLNWMGLRRIDWLCSMSNEKYDAIVGAGIQVMQRISLPDDYVKDNMRVELDAKVASGYQSMESFHKEEIAAQLDNLGAVRRQCARLYELAQKDELFHFTLDEAKLVEAVDFTEKEIRANYPDLQVPDHSRLRHFDHTEFTQMLSSWPCDKVEACRRVVDLLTVSVLMDAGAGPSWRYITKDGRSQNSSEGLASASLDMFRDGFFSSDIAMKSRVNSVALKMMSPDALKRGFQVTNSNQLVGVDGRAAILNALGGALEEHPDFFGHEVHRPGNMVDYLLKKAGGCGGELAVDHIWTVCMSGLKDIWPKHASGIRRGDVWPHSKLQQVGVPGSDLVPFHKLTQWLIYSIIEALEQMVDLKVCGKDQMTALAEYRNGGLLVDTGVLALKDPVYEKQELHVGSELVVEWRAMTVMLVDKMAAELRKRFGKNEEQLPLSKVLEAGTWRAGRSLARSLRSDGSPPLKIRSDGTVF